MTLTARSHLSEETSGLAVSGEVDALSSARLASAVITTDADDRARGRDARPFLLDLTSVTFLDTAGLDGLVKAQMHLHALHRPLVVLAPEARLPRWVLGFADERSWLPPGCGTSPLDPRP